MFFETFLFFCVLHMIPIVVASKEFISCKLLYISLDNENVVIPRDLERTLDEKGFIDENCVSNGRTAVTYATAGCVSKDEKPPL